jgi:glycerate-2-kinase
MDQGSSPARNRFEKKGIRDDRSAAIVKNADELLAYGNKKGRRIAIQIIKASMADVDTYAATRKAVRLLNRDLTVADRTYDLSRIGKVYVVGAGKATISMASALEDVLGERISKGHVIVKHGQSRRLKRIEVTEASHPLPNSEGFEGAKAVLNIADEAEEDDIVFSLITGGASALMPFPAPGIGLEAKRTVTRLLLEAGADILEINCVRNHISGIKGGRLAERIHPAQIVNLVVVDEIDRHIWGPTAPDSSTFGDAFEILHRYGLWKRTPSSVRRHIRKGLDGKSPETLKDEDFGSFKVQNVKLADNVSICEAADREAKRLGLNSMILTTTLRGESRQAGTIIGRIAREVEAFSRPIGPPCALIMGGETTVTLGPNHGKGGPSQELALSASREIRGSLRIVVASIDTDGTDGPTEVAGGLVDGTTFDRIRAARIDPFDAMGRHDSYRALSASGDAIITRYTGTNVMDLNLAIIT